MINQEAMGTTEPMNIEDSIEKQILVIHWTGWRNKPETLLSSLIFIQRSPGINIKLNIDIERVNIRQRIFFFLIKVIKYEKKFKKIKENKDLLEYSNANKNDIRDDDITLFLNK